jgi:hypothetical protein
VLIGGRLRRAECRQAQARDDDREWTPLRGALGADAPDHIYFSIRIKQPCGGKPSVGGFHWSLLGALYRLQLRLPARLDCGRKREQCGDVPFVPGPGISCTLHSVLCWRATRVRCKPRGSPSQLLMGCPLRTRGLRSSFTNVANPLGPRQQAAITTWNERFVSTAALNQRKYWTSGMQLADGVPDEAD